MRSVAEDHCAIDQKQSIGSDWPIAIDAVGGQ